MVPPMVGTAMVVQTNMRARTVLIVALLAAGCGKQQPVEAVRHQEGCSMRRWRRSAGCRLISVCAAVALLTGCATRSIYFTSRPSGGTVTVCGRTDTTPCSIIVPNSVCTAEISLPSGETRVVQVPKAAGIIRRTTAGVITVTSLGLKASAMPFIAAGAVGAVLLDLISDDDTPRQPMTNAQLELLRATCYALGVGFVLYGSGMLLDEVRPELPPDYIFVNFESRVPVEKNKIKTAEPKNPPDKK